MEGEENVNSQHLHTPTPCCKLFSVFSWLADGLGEQKEQTIDASFCVGVHAYVIAFICLLLF